MLRLAIAFELRALLRRRSAAVALGAFLAVGAIALLVGKGRVTQWREEVAKAQRAQDESIAEARDLFAQGRTSPADEPWIDLREPSWQDTYAGTRVTRVAGPLAGIAAGAVDSAPVAFKLDRNANPLTTGGYRIENPELQAGSVDLVFVLGILLPLLLGVLGLEVGARERQEGIDRLVAIYAGQTRGFLVPRVVAVAFIAGTSATLVCVGAGLAFGAGPRALASLVGAALLHTAAWSGLLLAVVARAPSVRSAAFAFGTLWMVLAVLLPTAAAEVALSRVPPDFVLAESVDARASRRDVWEREDAAALRDLYALLPELRRSPVAAETPPLDRDRGRAAKRLLAAAQRVERHRARRAEEVRAQAVSEQAAWLTPVVALGLALERLAGVGPEAASAYREHLVAAVEARARWVVTKAWTKAPLGANDFEALIAAAPQAHRATREGWSAPLLPILVWALVAWMAALTMLAAGERPARTTPRDPR